MKQRRKVLVLALILILAAVSAAGCGDGDGTDDRLAGMWVSDFSNLVLLEDFRFELQSDLYREMITVWVGTCSQRGHTITFIPIYRWDTEPGRELFGSRNLNFTARYSFEGTALTLTDVEDMGFRGFATDLDGTYRRAEGHIDTLAIHLVEVE